MEKIEYENEDYYNVNCLNKNILYIFLQNALIFYMFCNIIAMKM